MYHYDTIDVINESLQELGHSWSKYHDTYEPHELYGVTLSWDTDEVAIPRHYDKTYIFCYPEDAYNFAYNLAYTKEYGEKYDYPADVYVISIPIVEMDDDTGGLLLDQDKGFIVSYLGADKYLKTFSPR